MHDAVFLSFMVFGPLTLAAVVTLAGLGYARFKTWWIIRKDNLENGSV